MIPQANGIQHMVRQIQELPSRERDDLRRRAVHLSETLSQRQISLELGISRSSVFNLLREARS